MFLKLEPWQAVLTSLGIACSFVGVLYIGAKSIAEDRDDPRVIKRRLCSILAVAIGAPFVVGFWGSEDQHGPTLYEWLGLRTEGLFLATVLPLLVTMLLFFGPLTLLAFDYLQGSKSLSDLTQHFRGDRFWITVRNYSLGPLCEDIVFRSCICTLMYHSGLCTTKVIWLSPLFFGPAHLHHIVCSVLAYGYSVSQAVLNGVFQLAYTTVFGALAGYLFLRTGHLAAPLASHIFCNMMGPPTLGWLLNRSHPHYGLRYVHLAAHIAGVILFARGVTALTQPSWFGSPYFGAHH